MDVLLHIQRFFIMVGTVLKVSDGVVSMPPPAPLSQGQLRSCLQSVQDIIILEEKAFLTRFFFHPSEKIILPWLLSNGPRAMRFA